MRAYHDLTLPLSILAGLPLTGGACAYTARAATGRAIERQGEGRGREAGKARRR